MPVIADALLPDRPQTSASDATDVADVQSDSGSSATHLSCISAPAADGREEWTDSCRQSKMYNIMERRVDMRRLSASHGSVEELLDRRKRLHLYLSELLEQKNARIEQIKKLQRLEQCSIEWMAKATEGKRRLDALTEQYRQLQLQKSESLQGMTSASGSLRVESHIFCCLGIFLLFRVQLVDGWKRMQPWQINLSSDSNVGASHWPLPQTVCCRCSWAVGGAEMSFDFCTGCCVWSTPLQCKSEAL